MTFGDFKIYVAAYITRDPVSFVYGTVDLLTEAINEAKRAAQLEFDFPQLRQRAFVMSNYYGTDLSTAVDRPDPIPTPVPVVINTVKSAWRFATAIDSRTGYNDYVRTQQYDFISEDDLHNIVPDRQDAIREPNVLPITYKQRCYIRGTKIFVTGNTDPIPLWLDVVAFAPDYVLTTDTDFFLTSYKSWFTLKVLEQLNFLLKEDSRVAISNAAVAQRWNSVLAHANRLADDYNKSNSLS